MHRAMSPSVPVRRSARRWAPFALVTAVAWLLIVYSYSSSSFRSRHDDEVAMHPIETLFQNARAVQEDKLRRQSKTLAKARAEYERRYNLTPPNGYDAWFHYAQKHSSPIIDDYDELMLNLLPFRGYQHSHCDSHNQTQIVHAVAPWTLPLCIKDGKIDVLTELSPYDVKAFREPLAHLTQDFLDRIPDLCILVNHMDQPRINSLEAAVTKREGLQAVVQNVTECPLPKFVSYRRSRSWEAAVEHCAENSPARTGAQAVLPGETSLVQDWAQTTDVCSYSDIVPAGLFHSPDQFSMTNVSVPIFSPGVISTFADIMIPTLWRLRWDMNDVMDNSTWDEKGYSVGWRGTSTGGWAHDDSWRHFTRARMVALANGLNITNAATGIMTPSKRLSDWLDVQFSHISSCDKQTICEDIKKVFPLAEHQSLADNYRLNKIVLDMDGHGLSGRFYQLLGSNSLVMKQGIIREWHDSRVQPWLHYVPLSAEMLELEGVVEYLFGPGERIAKAIAEEGKLWANKALRREDMSIYTYRLLIELGRRTFSPPLPEGK